MKKKYVVRYKSWPKQQDFRYKELNLAASIVELRLRDWSPVSRAEPREELMFLQIKKNPFKYRGNLIGMPQKPSDPDDDVYFFSDLGTFWGQWKMKWRVLQGEGMFEFPFWVSYPDDTLEFAHICGVAYDRFYHIVSNKNSISAPYKHEQLCPPTLPINHCTLPAGQLSVNALFPYLLKDKSVCFQWQKQVIVRRTKALHCSSCIVVF